MIDSKFLENFNLFVMNTSMEVVTVVDRINSFIWTDRYNNYGDFTLVVPAMSNASDIFKQDYYISMGNTSIPMMIDRVESSVDVDEGSVITVTGRSLSYILDRRIVWKRTRLQGKIHDGIKKLLDENLINPSDSKRKVNMSFITPTDSRITGITIDAQYTGDNLFDAVQALCESNKIGFQVSMMPKEQQLVFELYVGTDHSYNQTDNSYVTFSPAFDNLINSNFITSMRSYKNVALVGGEGEGSARKFYTTTMGTGNTDTGLNRREMFVNASDISSKLDNNVTLSTTEYNKLLNQRGREKLTEKQVTTAFEGEADTTNSYTYGVDFNLGDIVEVADSYGHSTTCRVTEYIYSIDTDGIKAYPTFEGTEEGIPNE